MRGRRLWYLAIFTGLFLWVLYTPRAPLPLFPIRVASPAPELASAFDPARCGTVRGTVEWSGDAPVVEPIKRMSVRIPPAETSTVPNPNAPRVINGHVADAVVYLVGVDPKRSAAWKPDPVSVEARLKGFTVKWGKCPGRIAVVRRGDPVELVSCDPVDPVTHEPLHSIRGRGAAFFTQMLPVPDKLVSRTFSDVGIVEMSSGSGYSWLRGYLFVTDGPYATVTGSDGAISFSDVPDGEYEAVCWLPNWHVDRFENDPELSMWGGPVRIAFHAAVEKRQKMVVKAGQETVLKFTLSVADFDNQR
jgi:hypothetical protein